MNTIIKKKGMKQEEMHEIGSQARKERNKSSMKVRMNTGVRKKGKKYEERHEIGSQTGKEIN